MVDAGGNERLGIIRENVPNPLTTCPFHGKMKFPGNTSI